MKISLLLAGGDRRSIGRAPEVVALLKLEPDKLPEVMECLESENACIRMRAADVLEKVSRDHANLLQPFLLGFMRLLAESSEKAVRWHMALLIPRLHLSQAQCQTAAQLLSRCLKDPSSIVRTFAMQALSDLTRQCEELKPTVIDLIRVCTRTGSAAMRARGRMLLQTLNARS